MLLQTVQTLIRQLILKVSDQDILYLIIEV